MSVAAGPTAMKRPSREGSQVGWVARVETWMLILAWSYGWVWMNVVPGAVFVWGRGAGKMTVGSRGTGACQQFSLWLFSRTIETLNRISWLRAVTAGFD
jgi:hypothetical protein